MKNPLLFFVFAVFFAISCKKNNSITTNLFTEYFKQTETGIQTGGVKLVPINTPKGKFNVWTKRVGNNPKIKLLLLTGGPGCTSEYWECLESFLPLEGIEFIYYDQLGVGNSDNPKDSSMWDLGRYVDELEQVRVVLGLNKDNFYLLGHSWGGIIAADYALKYQDNLKGLIISNMMMSAPEYDAYADNVLAKQMPPAILDTIRRMEAKGDTENPRFMELLNTHFYSQHICRIPLKDWPNAINRSFAGINRDLYVTMQGPSEFGLSGKLEKWDRKADLPKIKVPTLVIGATHDTMDPEHMKWVAKTVQNGRFHLCPDGSHMCMWDDQKTYMEGLISFLKGK
jgi:proline iminopeptidase